MKKEDIRKAIAEDLRGKYSRNPKSLVPELSKQLEFGQDTNSVLNEVQQMKDIGHIIDIGSSIRLTEAGEKYYFTSKTDKIFEYLKLHWIAVLALIISGLHLLSSHL
jgi:hypothetical protein